MNPVSQIIITFGGALFFGIFFIILANKLKLPSIVVLLLGGIALGPVGLNIIDPSSLGSGLKAIIHLAVALVLFEGGLTLNIREYREVSSEIKFALTFGVLITWLASSAVIYYLFKFTWMFSILAGSLIIVTGPTVIGPLLKRINVKKNIHGFLHWEGILIDPIGVFIALLCYELIIGKEAIILFLLRILIGIVIGLFSGFVLSYIIKKRWILDEFLNIFILSSAIAIYILSDMVIHESGLMSVVISGFVIGYSDTPQINDIKIYKAQLIELLIGLLFILLAANLDIKLFKEHYGIEMLIAVIIVMFIIRPLNIFVSTLRKSNFSFREKLFLSWVAPRGIVAASMASLFAYNLKEYGSIDLVPDANFLEAFTYSIILGTVFVQGFTARGIGKLLNVLEPDPKGWLIIGAHNLAVIAGKFLKKKGYDVVLLDTNIYSVNVASREGLIAFAENAMTLDPVDHPVFYGIGSVLAITKNENLNELLCRRWAKLLNKPKLYQWRESLKVHSADEDKNKVLLAGIPVWNSIPLNKIVSTVLDENNFFEKQIKKDRNVFINSDNVLFYSEKKTTVPFFPEEREEKYTALFYNPFIVDLDFNIQPNWVIYSSSLLMPHVVMELLNCLKQDYSHFDIDRLHSLLMNQENEYSSAIGFNVSLPHAYIDDLDHSVVRMAKMKEPIKCIYNDEDISFIFLVLSPKDHPDLHIKTLSKISKFIMDDKNRKLLDDALSREDLIDLFFLDKI